MDVLKQVFLEVEKIFSDSPKSHDLDHTLRVYNLCIRIGEGEGADIFVLKLASLLHDVARAREDKSRGEVCHALEGSFIAEKILKSLGLKDYLVSHVVDCIKTHRFRGGDVPVSLEAKVLFDADKLDSIGAVGVGRAFLFAGEINSKLHNKDVDLSLSKPYSSEDTAFREYLVKLRYVKDRMMTEKGRGFALERHDFMKDFFTRLNKEVDGII